MSARSKGGSRLPSLVLRWGLGLGLAVLPLSEPQLFLADAQAFCGFFVTGADAAVTNNASQVALLRKGNRTVLTMSNNYKGPPEDFAMVVPVPVVLKKEDVKTLAGDVFTHIDQLSAPRLVEYWEQDPCQPPYPEAEDDVATERKSGEPTKKKDGAAARLGVRIEAKFEVGEYQILVLSAKESTGLETWLRQSKYKIPSGAAAALAPYVRDQQKFFVAKVDIKKVKRDTHGYVVLSPLRVAYDAAELRLPVRLGLLNAESKQDLIIYILHPQQRFEVANYRNVFIPTNLEVNNSVRKMFPAFYAELFDETLRRNNNRAVVTEYAWQTSSCDPCPTPPLEASDLYTLGDDSFAGASAGAGRAQDRPYYGSPPQYVLTRLHTRYDKQTLSEDLIFRVADPVVGGRSDGDGTLGDPTPRIAKQGSNNFQSRYIIRHYWEGKVACQSPSYGIWGGPPSGEQDGRVKAAGDLANAPRGAVKLPQVVESAVPMLGIAGKEKRPLRPGETRPKP
jgi:hypothetical protein